MTRPEARSNDHRRVLLVGVSSCFGPELAQRFVAGGAQLLATTRSGSAHGLPEGVLLAPLDLTQTQSLDAFANEVVPRFGSLDVVVFMAGLLPGKTLAAYDDELQQAVLAVNFGGQAALLRRLLPSLAHGAQVWMVSSISGERGSFDPVYAASKAALIGFVKSLATWLAPGLRANALAPALIEGSRMHAQMAPQRREYHRSTTPTGRLTTPQEVAAALFELCGPAWANLNGQVIRINGGAHV